jgi:transposase
MARPKVNVDSETILKAEEELGKIKESKVCIKLMAIRAAGENPVISVASIFKVSTRSIFRWIMKFKKGGVEALRDKPKGHLKSKLTEKHKEEIERWIVSGKNGDGRVVHWTLNQLQKEIKRQFGITIGITPLWKHLKQMNLVLKRPRPVYSKANKEAQDCFKKKSP